MPNAVMRTGTSKQVFIGDEMISSHTETSYAPAKWWKRPIDRGVVVDWALEQKIWDRGFYLALQANSSLSSSIEDRSFSEFQLLYTMPPLAPPMIQNVSQEVAFELYGFGSIFRCTPAFLTLHKQREINPKKFGKSPCSLVVDSGYSSTHILPFIGEQLVTGGIKRINIGGKMLDNYLKEVISFRQWNVVDESYLMTHIKEQLCFTSLDFKQDLQRAKKTNDILKQWVLPSMKGELGYLKNDETASNAQMLKMNNERFSIPEILFNPSHIGANQAGITESILQSVQSCPEEMHAALYSNIIIMGGCSNFPNFTERIYNDLRSLIPSDYPLNISLAEDPIMTPWHGGSSLARSSSFDEISVSKEQYQECGHNISKSFNT